MTVHESIVELLAALHVLLVHGRHVQGRVGLCKGKQNMSHFREEFDHRRRAVSQVGEIVQKVSSATCPDRLE